MMKKISVLFFIILGFCFISCGSTPVEEETKKEAPDNEVQSVEISEPDPVEDVTEPEDDVELINE